jgi:hypothetical protein
MNEARDGRKDRQSVLSTNLSVELLLLGNYMYHLLHQSFHASGFRMILTAGKDYFLKQH